MSFVYRSFFAVFVALSIVLSVAHAGDKNAGETTANSIVYRQGDYVVRQLVTPDFDRLPLNRKAFVFYLAQAIEAGRDVVWIQMSREGLAIRNLMDAMWKFSKFFSPRQKAALEEYLFKLHANHGHYDKNANQKFVLEGLRPEEFASMASFAQSMVTKAKKLAPESSFPTVDFVAEAKRLEKEIFDPEFNKLFHANKDGQDLVRDSAANFYGPGLTQDMLEKLPPEQRDHFLSYPYLDEKGAVRLELHRIGGRFSDQLQLITYFLKHAEKYANDAEKNILAAFRKTWVTGDPKDLLEAEALWVQYKPTDIDFVPSSFVEVYADPLGKRGYNEGFVMMLNQNPETIARINAIRANADYFERAMPVDEAYKKEAGFTPPKAEGAFLVFTGGANGERPFAGVNLPNDPGLHEKYGSKSYTALNVMHNYGPQKTSNMREINEMFYRAEYLPMLEKYDSNMTADVQVEFHEILGHGSGKNMPGVNDQALKEYYNALEEGRAEIASLYHLTDLKVRDFGILNKSYSDQEAREFAMVTILDFFTNQIRSYFKLKDDTTKIRQAHQWGRQVMLNRLMHDGALRVAEDPSSGVPKVEILDFERVRASLGQLWAEIQDAKANGSYDKAKAIFEAWGQYQDVHRGWRKKVLSAMEILNLPKEPMILNPQFEVTRDAATGEIKAISLKYVKDEPNSLGFVIERQIARSEFVRDCQKLLTENSEK